MSTEPLGMDHVSRERHMNEALKANADYIVHLPVPEPEAAEADVACYCVCHTPISSRAYCEHCHGVNAVSPKPETAADVALAAFRAWRNEVVAVNNGNVPLSYTEGAADAWDFAERYFRPLIERLERENASLRTALESGDTCPCAACVRVRHDMLGDDLYHDDAYRAALAGEK